MAQTVASTQYGCLRGSGEAGDAGTAVLLMAGIIALYKHFIYISMP
jgi:hypothetical protein